MREIKYRQAIFLKNGDFLEWHIWGFVDGQWIGPETHSSTIEGAKQHSYPFTTLRDKNGIEIYEGDILKLIVYKNVGKHSIRVVSFDRGCFGCVDTTGLFWPLGIVVGNKGNEKIFDVIGNIYENGELLGGQNEH